MLKIYEKQKRYIRLGGKGDNLAMEQIYWKFIDAMAKSKNLSWKALVTTLLEVRPPDYVGSRIAWLRFFVTQSLMRRAIESANAPSSAVVAGLRK